MNRHSRNTFLFLVDYFDLDICIIHKMANALKNVIVVGGSFVGKVSRR